MPICVQMLYQDVTLFTRRRRSRDLAKAMLVGVGLTTNSRGKNVWPELIRGRHQAAVLHLVSSTNSSLAAAARIHHDDTEKPSNECCGGHHGASD